MLLRTHLAWPILLLVAFLPTAQSGAVEWKQYGSDSEGKHYYDGADVTQPSTGIIGVMTSLLYSEEAKKLYLNRRQKSGMSNAGFDKLYYRAVRYEVNCFSAAKEFTILEVWELTRDGRTLDYARSGSHKEWNPISDGSLLDQLHKIVCPVKRQGP
jgi:hypothetical protein